MDKLKKKILENFTSLREYAKAIDKSEHSVSNYLYKGTTPPFTVACKMADALDISLDELRTYLDN